MKFVLPTNDGVTISEDLGRSAGSIVQQQCCESECGPRRWYSSGQNTMEAR
jgi:hypothetical protein